jgi:CheY-specific phosphatase CheX
VFEEMRETAVSVASAVFETMLFTFLEPRGGEEARDLSVLNPNVVFLRGEIGFLGKYSGKLRLTLPLELAERMVSNIMGLEEEKATESQAIDLVNELCNMICGNLSSRLAKSDQTLTWNLAIPQTQIVSHQEMGEEAGGPGIEVDFDADGDWVNLRIQMNA